MLSQTRSFYQVDFTLLVRFFLPSLPPSLLLSLLLLLSVSDCPLRQPFCLVGVKMERGNKGKEQRPNVQEKLLSHHPTFSKEVLAGKTGLSL